jgi:hypothetical protein
MDRSRLHPRLSAITNPKHRQIITFFTTKSSTKLTGPAKTKLSGYAAGFNLPDLPLVDVLARADDIRQRPDEVLPRVLQYDRLISQSHFEFVQGLWKHQCAFDRFAVWNSVSPHMYHRNVEGQ